MKAHVSAILQKLGVESRTQAVIAAAKIEAGQWPQAARGLICVEAGRPVSPSLAGPGRIDYSAAATRCTRHCASSARSAAGLSGLLQHLDVVRARLLAHRGRAVGGDQDRRQVGAEAPAQRGDRLDAVAAGRGDSRPAARSARPCASLDGRERGRRDPAP